MSEQLPLEYICQFLNDRVPGIKVAVDDELCRSKMAGYRGDFDNRIVIGACSKLTPKHDIWHEATNSDIDLSYTRIVDLLRMISDSNDETDVVKTVKLLLLAQIKRLTSAGEASRYNHDIRFTIPKSLVNRRQFLKTALPRYESRPYIEPSRCPGTDKCGLCRDVCSYHAILHQAGEVSIDGSICSGCGACMAICPNEAVLYPAYSLEELEAELEGLLFDENDGIESRIIALSCLGYVPDSSEKFPYPLNILPMDVPCLSAISPWLLLRAFELGAQGLVLIADDRKCSNESCPSIIHNNICFVRSILHCMNIGEARIKLLKISDNNRMNVEDELQAFAAELAKLNPTPFKYNDGIPLVDNRHGIHALIGRMGKKSAHFERDIVSTHGVSLGKVTIDSSKCTGCDLCSLNCPAGALTRITDDNGECQLLFHSEPCVACGVCVNICPENCVQLHHILELDKLCNQELLLAKTSVENCRRCGKDIAPKAMIASLRKKLGKAGCGSDYLDLCPECKASSRIIERVNKDNLIRI